ncbi:glycosyltransferase family 2 protein [Desulfogranum japonicum]|uniref:glycosyltransferase family 2 protein n=1 Tax=Desulfogranum japonicum TaxID=231447 RepID=UPI000407A7E6|nr:glycosyltransferase [Desulfogranum japonicum]
MNVALRQKLRHLRRKILKLRFSLYRPYQKILQSGLFDEEYYFRTNEDLSRDEIDPLIHYLQYGHAEGRKPNCLFETAWYPGKYRKVLIKGTNPLYHYICKGWKEGKNPCALFETRYYLQSHPEIANKGINPLFHYLQYGAWNGSWPNPRFDSAFYLSLSPELFETKENPLAHYMRRGKWEGRSTMEREIEFDYAPTISLLTPVYNVPESFLRDCVQSVLLQSYPHWELCLADDGSSAAHIRPVLEELSRKDTRIKVVCLDENKGIAGATNAAASLATGEYIGFLDNDDELTRDALLEVVRLLNEQKADIIYSDECIVNSAGELLECHYKPDYSPDLLRTHNYITHFLVIRRELFQQVGGVGTEYNGAQDYDLLLKVTDKTNAIRHIPQVLYRWRTIETSTSANPDAKSYAHDAGKKALQASLQRQNVAADVLDANLPFYYRVRRQLTHQPLVSIIIPFHNQPQLLQQCIESVVTVTSYDNIEILGVSNNSDDPAVFELMNALSHKYEQVRFFEFNHPFNYSEINNYAVNLSKGEHVVLMNNDIEVLNHDWLACMLEHSQREDVGAVGAKLYYPDDTIQHAGVILGIGGFAGHAHRHADRKDPGYFNRLNCIQDFSAVTAALLMVKRRLYDHVGGLDEEHLGIALNDVDFCLKLREAGFLNVFTPYAEAYHHESASRGYEDTAAKKKRFNKEVAYFKERWAEILEHGDPYYNLNLCTYREDFARDTYVSWYTSDEERKAILTQLGVRISDQ